MSWQTYIDDHLLGTEMVKEAVICGHDGTIWAQSKDFNVTAEELKDLSQKIGKTDQLATSGILINGKKYIYLSSTDKVVRAKLNTAGIHIIKTNKAIIICTYDKPLVAEQTAMVTEKLGDYLISVGY